MQLKTFKIKLLIISKFIYMGCKTS